MKTTIAKLLNSDRALSALLEQKLPLAVSIQLGKVVDEIKPIFEKAQERRTEILHKYGEEVFDDETKSGQFRIKPENVQAFEDEIRKEFEAEVELSSPQIDPERLPDACLTGAEAIALSWLWKEGSNETDN